MKINDTLKGNPGLQPANTPANNTRAADKAATTTATTQAQTDSVRLSSQGQAMANAVGSNNQVFDTKKVERIKMAIPMASSRSTPRKSPTACSIPCATCSIPASDNLSCLPAQSRPSLRNSNTSARSSR